MTDSCDLTSSCWFNFLVEPFMLSLRPPLMIFFHKMRKCGNIIHGDDDVPSTHPHQIMTNWSTGGTSKFVHVCGISLSVVMLDEEDIKNTACSLIVRVLRE